MGFFGWIWLFRFVGLFSCLVGFGLLVSLLVIFFLWLHVYWVGLFFRKQPPQIHLDKTKTTSSFRVFLGLFTIPQELGAFWRLLGGTGGRLPRRAFCQALLASQQAPSTPAIPAAPAERWRDVGRKAAMTPVRPAKAQEALLR